jgi:hypothetical protein
MDFELINFDNVGQSSIITRSANLDDLVSSMEDALYEDNLQNALVEDQQRTEFATYWINFFDKKTGKKLENLYFGGLNRGKPIVLNVEKGKLKIEEVDESRYTLQFYLGKQRLDNIGKQFRDVTAIGNSNKEIKSLKDGALQNRGYYFIKPLK